LNQRLATAAAVLCLSLAGCAALGPATDTLPVEGKAVRVVAEPLPLDPRDPGKDRVGAFVFAGAVKLTSPDTDRFHGFSDLKIVGDRLYAVNDDGAETLEARLALAPDGKIAGLTEARVAVLPGPDGKPLQDKAETDAEGMAILPGGDRLYSFERDHRILRYPAHGAPPVRAPMPPVTMPNNDGMEGLAPARHVARDAYWVGIEDDGEVWLCRVSTSCRKIEGLPSPPPGYRLSGMAETPAGDLVLLHHWYDRPTNGSHTDVSVVRSPLAKPRVIGRFRLDSPMTVDNFEGVDVVRRPNGGFRLYFLVDDNFYDHQATILEAFDWTPPR
jgi:hypothetical protein